MALRAFLVLPSTKKLVQKEQLARVLELSQKNFVIAAWMASAMVSTNAGGAAGAVAGKGCGGAKADVCNDDVVG